MGIVTLLARLLLGLVFTVFGANGFFHFLPMPPMQGKPLDLIMALVNSGYLMQVVFTVQIVCGVLLLLGLFVPLALVLLAPIIVNIVLFHAMLEAPQTLVVPLVVTALELFLISRYWAYFAALFTPFAKAGWFRTLAG
jgi:uncharacterized membrane protein YphA (DoxX/SURF4 family)